MTDDLDTQWLDAVARDDERDLRMAARLTPQEFRAAATKIASWPESWQREVLEMGDNELRWIMLTAALLDGAPENLGGVESSP